MRGDKGTGREEQENGEGSTKERERVRARGKGGTTVVRSSEYYSKLERVCNCVAHTIHSHLFRLINLVKCVENVFSLVRMLFSEGFADFRYIARYRVKLNILIFPELIITGHNAFLHCPGKLYTEGDICPLFPELKPPEHDVWVSCT